MHRSAMGLLCWAKGRCDEVSCLGPDAGMVRGITDEGQMLYLRHRDDRESHKLALSLFIHRDCLGDIYGSKNLSIYLLLPKLKYLWGVSLSFVVQALFQDEEEDSVHLLFFC